LANGRTGKKAKAAARRERRRGNAVTGAVTEALEESEADRLAAEHLAELDRHGVEVGGRRPVEAQRLVTKPTVENSVFVGEGHPLAPPGGTILSPAAFKDYTRTLQAAATSDPGVARLLLDLDGAPQLVCDCGLGRYCHARPIMHFARQLGGLANLAEGMRLLDCCWWAE